MPGPQNKEIISKAKNYFNEAEFCALLSKYQQSIKIEDGTIIEKNIEIETDLTKRVEKIVKAIIMIYRYYIFEDYEDLMQHAMHACFKNFVKFDPTKGTAFNYFSIIAKISLLNYTTRRKKHRELHDIADYIDLEAKEQVNYSLFFDNLEGLLFDIINRNYVGKIRKQYIKITTVLVDYLRKTKVFISKTDLYSWTRSYGIKNAEVRQYVAEMNKYNDKIFSLVE